MKRLLYTLCFFFLCVIDQRKGSVTGEMQLFWSNCTGFLIALIVFSHYQIKDFLKRPYLVWTIIGAIGFAVCKGIFRFTDVTIPVPPVQWYSACANVFVYGFLVIRTVIDLHDRTVNMKKVLFQGFVCVMFALMGMTRNDYVWPWYFLMIFGVFAFTDFCEKERRTMALALADGLILGFFCIQGLAFVFRPYDQIRYLGMYANPNINALFYSLVYCAFLVRLFYFLFECKCKMKILFASLTMFFSGAMWSFCLLTGCRTAMISMGVITGVAGLLCIIKFQKRVIIKSLGMIVGLAFCIVCSFPIVYGCVRYIPGIFKHPIWFFQEYSISKVHSMDPIDSEKYIDWEELLEYLLERTVGIEVSKEEEPVLLEMNRSFALQCSTSEYISEEVGQVALVANEIGSGEIRRLIAKYYVSNLNMTGHLIKENGVQVTPRYFAPHAHNLYLQMAFDFGIPIGIIFVGYVLVNIVRLSRNAVMSKDSGSMGLLLLFMNSCIFGILEMMWTNGYTAFTLLFLVTLISPWKYEKSSFSKNLGIKQSD